MNRLLGWLRRFTGEFVPVESPARQWYASVGRSLPPPVDGRGPTYEALYSYEPDEESATRWLRRNAWQMPGGTLTLAEVEPRPDGRGWQFVEDLSS